MINKSKIYFVALCIIGLLVTWDIAHDFFDGLAYPFSDWENLRYSSPFAIIVLLILLVEDLKKTEKKNKKNNDVQNGAQRWNRTTDTRIFSPLLYRLSYLGIRDKEISVDLYLSQQLFQGLKTLRLLIVFIVKEFIHLICNPFSVFRF